MVIVHQYASQIIWIKAKAPKLRVFLKTQYKNKYDNDSNSN